MIKQDVALTGRNRRAVSTARPPTHPVAGSVTDDDRRQTTTDDSEQNNTGPLGGPVIIDHDFCYVEWQKFITGYFVALIEHTVGRVCVCVWAMNFERMIFDLDIWHSDLIWVKINGHKVIGHRKKFTWPCNACMLQWTVGWTTDLNWKP